MYQHWTLTKDADNIAWLYIDRQDSSVNTLNKAVLEEFSTILTTLSNEKNIQGLVIGSGKTSGFIAGADIQQFEDFKDKNEAGQLVRKGQLILEQLEDLPFPTVAMIQGFCLGGGLELALACQYRVADEGPKTRLGLPEILLGIHPGWGGTVRLPKLIGALQAMDLILTGRMVSAKAAAKIGIIDAAVPERQLKKAVVYYITQKPTPHTATIFQNITNQSFVRPWLAKLLKRKVAQKASPDHYPAPYATIDNWVKNGVEEQAYEDEARSLAEMFFTDTSRNLVRLFFLQEKLKGLAKGSSFKPTSVHVVGAGTMGGDIAAWCALKGLKVTLQDREEKYIAPAIARAAKLFTKKLKNPREVEAAMDRLMPDVNGYGIAHADVIIEAIFENLEAKQNLFKQLEAQSKPTALLATNTSSIPLDEINQVLKQPDRLVGIHFFNPVAMMQLVEVVKGNQTHAQTFNDAIAFVRRIDKLPLPVKSHPGFLVNRILMPYLMECMKLMEDHYSPQAIDAAAKKFGMPMGPVELADAVGLDVCLSVAKNLTQHFGGEVPQALIDKVNMGQLGKKTGEGFYKYSRDGKIISQKTEPSKPEESQVIADRLILCLLNEATAVYREKIADSTDLIDAGMVFGTGFAPFRGGPLHYAQTVGIDNIKSKLRDFEEKYGERFKPDAGWDEMKKEN